MGDSSREHCSQTEKKGYRDADKGMEAGRRSTATTWRLVRRDLTSPFPVAVAPGLFPVTVVTG